MAEKKKQEDEEEGIDLMTVFGVVGGVIVLLFIVWVVVANLPSGDSNDARPETPKYGTPAYDRMIAQRKIEYDRVLAMTLPEDY